MCPRHQARGRAAGDHVAKVLPTLCECCANSCPICDGVDLSVPSGPSPPPPTQTGTMTIQVSPDYSTALGSDAAFAIRSRAQIPVLGFVELNGEASTETGFWVEGAFSLNFLVVHLAGSVEARVPAGITDGPTLLAASGSAHFCLFGSVSVAGHISSDAGARVRSRPRGHAVR